MDCVVAPAPPWRCMVGKQLGGGEATSGGKQHWYTVTETTTEAHGGGGMGGARAETATRAEPMVASPYMG